MIACGAMHPRLKKEHAAGLCTTTSDAKLSADESAQPEGNGDAQLPSSVVAAESKLGLLWNVQPGTACRQVPSSPASPLR